MMPRVIGNNSLIERVNEVEGVMYRQSNELGRLNKAVKKYKDENTKLRELVQGLWFAAQYLGMTPYGATGSGFARQMRELGIEVGK